MLFEFNDDFIGAMAGGLSDEDTLELIEDGLHGMGDALARSIGHAVDGDYPVHWDGGAFVIPLDEAGVAEEYGSPNDGAAPPQRITLAVARARNEAERAFEGVFSAHSD